MRMFFGAAALAMAVVGFGTPDAAAQSGDRCVAAINQLQSRIGNGGRSEAQRELDAAYQAHKAGDSSACLRHADRAAGMTGDRGFSGSSREPDRYYDRRSDDRSYDRRSDDRYDRRWGR